MISPVSSNSDIYTSTVTSAPVQTPAKSTPPQQDSVHLSPQAQAAATGDVDHDGDSH